MSENESAIWCHECCGSGIKFRNKFILEHPGVEIITKNFFNSYHDGLHTKYGFDINDLKKGSIIIYKEQVIKEVNC